MSKKSNKPYRTKKRPGFAWDMPEDCKMCYFWNKEKHFIQAKFIRPKIRPYQTNNDYRHLSLIPFLILEHRNFYKKIQKMGPKNTFHV